ncbi:hypothetical protein [Gynurincola endophyticus]|jgi:VanZ family protein|uniref:hypothetical protein n=1 Tax=Gynurincola endophyticus TaxID=2479004 RepID=UPI000F8F4F78|nr:hypothetical protein [Gynurincola endophyticus]
MFQNVAPDKKKHFWVGLAMGIVLQFFGLMIFHFHWAIILVIAFLVCFLIAYGFELFSKFTGWGHYEVNDAIATVIGSLLGLILTTVMYYIII